MPPLPPLSRLIFPQRQARKAQQESLLITAPDLEDLVLLAVRLRDKKKENFDTFLIDDNAEISINKVFLEYNLNSVDTNDTDSDNKDWKDFYLENAQKRRSLLNSSENDDNDDNKVTFKSCSTIYAIKKLI